jgi:hypothetical protein
VSRNRTVLVVVALIGFGIASTILFASGSGHQFPSVDGKRIGPTGTGITAVLPDRWSGTISAGTFFLLEAERDTAPSADEPPMFECPPGYLNSLRIHLSEGNDDTPRLRAIPRPAEFSEAVGSTIPGDGDNCDVRSQDIAFTDAGRTLRVELLIGRDVSKEQLREAYSILDSLKIEPKPNA